MKEFLKGRAPAIIRLVTSGVDPLPDPSDPLNRIYPGPLAEGDYIYFLKPIKDSDLYNLVGVWQGVYPVSNGKTIALEGEGYPQFHQLSLTVMKKKIKKLDSES